MRSRIPDLERFMVDFAKTKGVEYSSFGKSKFRDIARRLEEKVDTYKLMDELKSVESQKFYGKNIESSEWRQLERDLQRLLA